MHYLRWFKVHPPARYELTGSGVPAVSPTDLDADSLPVSLEVNGAYGDPDLLEAIAKLYGVRPQSVVPVPGTSSANFIALAASAEHGSCVMIEHPCYDPLVRAASFLGLKVMPLQRRPELSFEVRIEQLEAGLRSGVRAVVITNLHNPSGQLLWPDIISQIARLCARVDATLVVDEVYLDAACITGRGSRWTAAALADNVIATNSLTKVYGLGGLRAGWLLADAELAERARDVMDVLSVNNAAPATALARHALARLTILEERYRRFCREGQPFFRQWLADEPLIGGYQSFGAVFECVRLPDGVEADRLSELLAREFDTQVVPGRFFGLDGHIRLSIALPTAELTEALSRISKALRQLVEGED